VQPLLLGQLGQRGALFLRVHRIDLGAVSEQGGEDLPIAHAADHPGRSIGKAQVRICPGLQGPLHRR